MPPSTSSVAPRNIPASSDSRVTTPIVAPALLYCIMLTSSCYAVAKRITKYNKPAQSNLGRGPRRSAVAHVRRKVPIGYNGAPQIRPQKYPFPWTDPQTRLPTSSLDPSDLWRQTAAGSDPPFFHNALYRQTNRRPTDRPTDRSFTGKFDDYRPLRYESDAA